MNKFFIFLGVLVYTLLVGMTVFSITKYYMFTKITREIEYSFIDYDFNTFIGDCLSIDIEEKPEPKYGVQEINGQTCFVLPGEEYDDPKLAMVLMIPVFLTMDLIPIEHKKPKRISFYI